jgi:hypothetical protein
VVRLGERVLVMRTITVTDGVLRAWADNAAIAAAFPFLAATKGGGRGCGGCRKNTSSAGGGSDRVKLAIAGLPPDRVEALKRMVRADTLILYYRQSGKTESLKL